MKTVKGIRVDRNNLTSNTQKVAYTLLSRNGWVSRKELERYVPSASARLRDLRKEQFGRFNVECASASELGKRGDSKRFFYRIRSKNVSVEQVKTIFRI